MRTRRAALVVVLAAVATAAAGCGDDEAEPNGVDAARLRVVAGDPQLAGAAVRPASTDVLSTHYRYRRARVHLQDAGSWAAVPTRVRAMVAEGWRLTWVSCTPADDVHEGRQTRQLQLARSLDATGAAVATVAASRYRDGSGSVTLDVVVEHHLDSARTFPVASGTLQPADTCLAHPPRPDPGAVDQQPVSQGTRTDPTGAL